jgi:hypothetical protein
VRYIKSSLTAVAFVLMATSNAFADSITFVLDCTYSGVATNGECGAPTGPFGTVTISDGAADARFLDIEVDLTDGFFLHFLYLNLPADFVNGSFTTWEPQASPSINSVTQDVDNKGTTYLYLDLAVRSSNNPTDPWVGTISLRDPLIAKPNGFFDLDPSLFFNITSDPQANNTPPPSALTYLAVNRVNCSGCTSPVFSMVGSYSVVPEPASLLLFGTGLSALGVQARRRLRNRKRD